MNTETHVQAERSYGCSFGCGNPYDYIVISVADATTEFLCLPCYVRLAVDMVAAVTDTGDPKVREAMAAIGGIDIGSTPGPKGKPRGKNAPVGNADDAIFGAYDGTITVEDLPPEFR